MARQETKAELQAKCTELEQANDDAIRRIRAAEFRISELERDLKLARNARDSSLTSMERTNYQFEIAQQALDAAGVPKYIAEPSKLDSIFADDNVKQFNLMQRIVLYVARKGAY